MLILFRCNLCGNDIKKLFGTKDLVPGYISCECSGIMEKQIPEFAMQSYETVDNGNMTKKVQIRRDAAFKSKQKGDLYIKEMEDRDKVIKKDEA